jgi:hypothetical protein
MRSFWAALGAIVAVGFAGAPAAFADCVDYSQSRAARAGAALERNPPTADQLGVPSLEGYRLDGVRTTGDPECNGPPTRFVYVTSLTSEQVLTALFPFVDRKVSVDGMNRQWFENPMSARGEVRLTSGAIVEIPQSFTAANITVVIDPPDAVLALTEASQPYSVRDMLDGTPWPGGGEGPRQFVRADGGDAGYRASNNNSQTGGSQQSAATQAPANCPPASSSNGSSQGAQAGGALGGALGGQAGRAAGQALGGLFGRRGSQSEQVPPANPDCPR